ncbi:MULTISPECIES: hypothetical protein [Rufibacter]|uniref:DNA topoisomerase IV n=1 Tax=Rufibacter quisquiliarum TaxID=1549639 RepID=A0A839GYW9_9BACT|nr:MULTISPECIES: hypothetical protein [Rufibacter]MBA9079886.1 hypothetical protein [Rufibacter quisquiliarum]
MYKYLLLACLLITSCSAYSQSDCKNFRIGKFQNVENGVIKSKITRSDSLQIEEYGNVKVTLKIEWIDDCTYRLIFKEGNESFWASRPKDRPTPDLIVRITKTEKDSYLQEAKFVGDNDFQYKSNMVKVK